MWLRQHRDLSYGVGIMLASLLLVVLAVLPIYQSASGILRQIERKSVELDGLNDKVSILTQLDPSILDERVVTLDQALPPRKDVLLYLTAIDGLSRELGLTFGGLSLAPGEITEASASSSKKKTVQKPKGLQGLDTEIKINGGKDNVYTFLRIIEEILPLMQIKDIKVSALSDGQYSLGLTLSMLWAEPETVDVKSKITLFGEAENKYFEQLASYRSFENSVGATPIQLAPKQDLFAPFASEVTPQP